jgi:hypothetical protein
VFVLENDEKSLNEENLGDYFNEDDALSAQIVELVAENKAISETMAFL